MDAVAHTAGPNWHTRVRIATVDTRRSFAPCMDVNFGEFEFSSGTRLLRRQGELVPLTRKAQDLLILLLENRPNVVSKEAIHARLWRRTFVSEASVQGLVAELRRALADDPHQPKFIRTVHGVGYAFSGPVATAPSRGDGSHRAVAWLMGETGELPLMEGVHVIGRAGPGVIALDSPTVSRRHARLTLGADAVLEDLGSKNGTLLNDRLISGPTAVAEGDRIRIGTFLFTFRSDRSADTTQTISRPKTRTGRRRG